MILSWDTIFGAATILVRTGYGGEYEAAGTVLPDHVASDLVEAAEFAERWLSVGPSPFRLPEKANLTE